MADNLKLRGILDNFGELSNASFEMILKNLTFRDCDRKETIIELNRNNKWDYFLLDGVCKSYRTDGNGKEIILDFFVGPGIITPNIIRTKDQQSLLSFKCITNCRFGVIEASTLGLLLREQPDLNRIANEILTQELQSKTEREIELISLKAADRLLKFRAQFPNLENIAPLTDISSYLGISAESLSRLRTESLKSN